MVLALLAVAALVLVRAGGGAGLREETLTVDGVPEPGGGPVRLDATIFRPAGSGRAPAVLLAHGFGGSKADLVADARALARHGYVVLTYTARGFGRSGGSVHIDAPGFEVADASRLLDVLARRPEVLLDRSGDPRVGVAGASYGGGLALLLAGLDPRVDAVAAGITWNDLERSLFPQQAITGAPRRTPAGVTPIGTDGVFKRGWAGVLFSGAAGPGPATRCGRFAADVCAAYLASAAAGRPAGRIEELLAASSPARVLAAITAPTLLLQGQTDGLFPLAEAAANARGIAAAGTPVKQVWFAGGHDGGQQEVARQRTLRSAWFDRYLRRDGSRPDTRFEVTSEATSALGRSTADLSVRAATGGLRTASIRLRGDEQPVVSPAGGSPATLTSVPGAGTALAPLLARVPAAAPPGQSARFETAALAHPLRVVGSPTVVVRVASGTGEATLFAAVQDVGPDGRATLPHQLVAPVHVTGLPAAGRDVRIALPAVVLDLPAGHRLRVVLSSTDQAYALPAQAQTYRLGLAGDSALTVPEVPMTTLGGTSSRRLLAAAAVVLLVLVLAVAALALRSRRRRGDAIDPALAGVPLVITGLGKAYSGGYRAVTDLSFRVEPGQVLGLLGPNGAGKTTTLRMLMGLILPSEGELVVFGQRIRPGAPVLSRIGCFVEGPGFLPHLSGLANLELYWRATGRPAEQAHLDVVLEVAGLGDDVHRTVRTYSQGMRQRLAIAQAMLGLPEMLVLDEPTNGLDPPQIREMREVLTDYAAGGRTVLVSSHLLAEVEQTCTDVVVMNRGRLVAQGPVAELVGSATAVAVDVSDPARAARVAAGVDGAHDVVTTETGITLRLVGGSRPELVRALVAAGLDVDRLAPQHGLEEAFLALIGEDSA